jgi:hypothetical protein
MIPLQKESVINLKKVLVVPSTEERVVVYNGIATVVTAQIIQRGLIEGKDGLTKAKIYIKEFVFALNEVTIVDRTLLEKTILCHLMYRVNYLKPDEVFEKANTLSDFMDVFKVDDYFSKSEIELINNNIPLFKQSLNYTQMAINDILPDMD